MAVSEAHKKASYKYNASRDSITIRPERSKGAAIRAAAVASGKSLQNYILDALNAKTVSYTHLTLPTNSRV